MSASCRTLYTPQAALSYMMVALTQTKRCDGGAVQLLLSLPKSHFACLKLVHTHRHMAERQKRKRQYYISIPTLNPFIICHLLQVVVLPIPVMSITIPNPPRAERAARRSSVRMTSGTNFVSLDNHIQRELHEGSPVLN